MLCRAVRFHDFVSEQQTLLSFFWCHDRQCPQPFHKQLESLLNALLYFPDSHIEQLEVLLIANGEMPAIGADQLFHVQLAQHFLDCFKRCHGYFRPFIFPLFQCSLRMLGGMH